MLSGVREIGLRAALLLGAVCVAVCGARAETQPYSRYQSIVDRQMFGMPPPGFDPTKPASAVSAKEEREKAKELTKEQEQLKSAIKFSAINVTPAGETAVGFTDNSDPKCPAHYYLKVGESRNGWTVKAADAIAATMTIQKGEIEVALSLGGDSSKGGGTSRVGASAPAAAPQTRPGLQRNGLLGGALGSLRERRQRRMEDERKAVEEAKAREEKAREERAAQEAQRAQEKAEREKERDEQRAQLLKIQEELKKAREERAAAEKARRETDEKKSEEGEKSE